MSAEKLKPTKAQGRSAPSQTVPSPPAKPITPPLFRKIDWLTFGVTALLVFIGYYLTLAPDLTLEDSGELATGSFYAGVPHPPGSFRAATRTSSSRGSIANSWFLTRTSAPRSGHRGSGRVPCSWRARWSEPGDVRGRPSRSSPGAFFRRGHGRRSRRRRSRSRCLMPEAASAFGGMADAAIGRPLIEAASD